MHKKTSKTEALQRAQMRRSVKTKRRVGKKRTAPELGGWGTREVLLPKWVQGWQRDLGGVMNAVLLASLLKKRHLDTHR